MPFQWMAVGSLGSSYQAAGPVARFFQRKCCKFILGLLEHNSLFVEDAGPKSPLPLEKWELFFVFLLFNTRLVALTRHSF